MNWLRDRAKFGIDVLLLTVCLLFSLSFVVVPIFWIAALVDIHAAWFLLYIPWVLTLDITSKPLMTFFGYGVLMSFKAWLDEDEHDLYNFPDEAMEKAFNEGSKQAALKCKQIAQQRYLAENQAVEIDAAISEKFNV